MNTNKPVRFVYEELDKFPPGYRIQSECEDGPRYLGRNLKESITNYCQENGFTPFDYRFLLDNKETEGYDEIDVAKLFSENEIG